LFVKSYFLEYTSLTTQPKWLDNLERVLGKEHVVGARAHVSINSHEDHVLDAWNALMTQVHGPQDEARVLVHLATISETFGAYFLELHRAVAADTRAQRRGEDRRR
jgi:hypothetical protein